jgi:hypothetical protein
MKIIEGSKAYATQNISNHPFRIGETLWVIFNSSDQMFTCQNYHRNITGYLLPEELEPLRPEIKKEYKYNVKNKQRATPNYKTGRKYRATLALSKRKNT